MTAMGLPDARFHTSVPSRTRDVGGELCVRPRRQVRGWSYAPARAWLLRTWRGHAGAVAALLSEAVATRRAARSLRSFRAS
jgi:hypothetical protein